jgi:hypothetical protein
MTATSSLAPRRGLLVPKRSMVTGLFGIALALA